MDRSERTDADLVRLTREGDAEAFGVLFDRYARVIRAVVLAVSRDPSAVEDVTQETFLRAFRKLNDLREPHQFGSWVVGISRKTSLERNRSRSRDRHQFVAGGDLEIADPGSGGAERLQSQEELLRLLDKVGQLPERERLAIHLFFLEQLDVLRAAETLELSRSGFYALLQRALARLAHLVEPSSELKPKP